MTVRFFAGWSGVLVAVSMGLVSADVSMAAEGVEESALDAGTELTLAPPRDLTDVPLAVDPALSERSSSVVANPKHPNMLVLVRTDGDFGPCVAYPVRMPGAPGRRRCRTSRVSQV
jgi:hypothetical protein